MTYFQARWLNSRVLRRFGWAIGALVLWVWAPAMAQDDSQQVPAVTASAPEAEPIALPGVTAIANALASTEYRQQTLVTLAAVANTRREAGGLMTLDAWDGQVSNDRAWLSSQLQRFRDVLPNSPMLDPAAWRVQLQLEQQQLRNSDLASPLGPGLDTLLAQAFNREDPVLAAVALPELMWYLDARGSLIWSEVLTELVQGSEASEQFPDGSLWSFLPSTDLPDEPLDPLDEPVLQAVLERSRALVTALAGQLTSDGPPDPSTLFTVRNELLRAMPAMNEAYRAQAGRLIHLAGLLDGLSEKRYFRFTEGLLAISAQMSLEASLLHEATPTLVMPMAPLLGDMLPRVSASFAPGFSAVDPRLNTALAASFDVARSLSRGNPAGQESLRLQGELADSVARLALMVPDMGFYFDLPVRDPVAGGVDACTGMVSSTDSGEAVGLTRELFDDCLQSLVDLADDVAREPQLAGDPDGPFGESQLNRELSLTAGQRINYGLGYLHETYSTGCERPGRQLPNPLEWAFLASFLTWFAEQSPVYFQTPENEQRLARMRRIGTEMTAEISEQVDCIAGVGVGVNDPVKRVVQRYQTELNALADKLQSAQQEFRGRYLAPGADVDLGGEITQSTAYRPDQLQILPCDAVQVCEMSGPLASTRALVGLFPDTYLLADQSRLGKVEICYDEMGWQQRRSEPVRPDDENVANYFGHLAFVLRGRFTDRNDTRELFAFRFESPEEYHYMFAAASPEILEDACPVEWIGQRIVTTMPDNERRLVPNRLTYLSAPRMQPSRLLTNNWERGAEWRDWFVTGIGVDRLPLPEPANLEQALSQHLQSLRRLEQEAIYGSMLRRGLSNGEQGLTPLFRELNRLDNAKSLLRLQLMLFYPHVLTQSDPLRGSIAGNAGLLDADALNRFREQRVPIADMLVIARDRLQQFETEWAAIPEVVRRRGSSSDSVIHAQARLSALQDRFFTNPLPVVAPTIEPAAIELEPMPPAPAIPAEGESALLTGDDGELQEEPDAE